MPVARSRTTTRISSDSDLSSCHGNVKPFSRAFASCSSVRFTATVPVLTVPLADGFGTDTSNAPVKWPSLALQVDIVEVHCQAHVIQTRMLRFGRSLRGKADPG